jgi:hypothetical protein
MSTIHLSEEEQQFLVEMLQREIPSLRDEILHTDEHDYREFLKEREKLVGDLLGKFEESK